MSVGDTVRCIEASQPWENPKSIVNRTNEGSFVFRYKDKYFMTYSANSWDNPNYGIGYATSGSPFGPWTKSASNPIIHLDTAMGVYGPGHSSMIYSPDGKEMFIAYHTHISATNKGRKMNIDRVYIDDSMNLRVLGPTRTPQPMPSGTTVSLINVNSLVLSKQSGTVAAGSSMQLSIVISPVNATIKEVFWKSTDPATAVVSSTGLVSAVSPGTTTIIVSSYEGNKKDTCLLTVTGIKVSSVILDKQSIYLAMKDSLQLAVSFVPVSATNQSLTWTTDNYAVASVTTSGMVKASKTGSAKIIVTSADGSFKDTCVVSVIKASVNTDLERSRIRIYPNPARDYINIPNASAGSFASILNDLGSELIRERIVSDKGFIDVSILVPGQYIVMVHNKSCIDYGQFVKE